MRVGELKFVCSAILSGIKGLLLVWISAVSLLKVSWLLSPDMGGAGVAVFAYSQDSRGSAWHQPADLSGCPSLPLEPTMAAITAPTPRASVRWCPAAWEHLQGKELSWCPPPTLPPPPHSLCAPSNGTLPLWQVLAATEHTLSYHSPPSSGCLRTANPDLFLGSDL